MKNRIEKEVQLLCPQCGSKELTKDDNEQVTCYKCNYKCSWESLIKSNEGRLEKEAIKMGEKYIDDNLNDLIDIN